MGYLQFKFKFNQINICKGNFLF